MKKSILDASLFTICLSVAGFSLPAHAMAKKKAETEVKKGTVSFQVQDCEIIDKVEKCEPSKHDVRLTAEYSKIDGVPQASFDRLLSGENEVKIPYSFLMPGDAGRSRSDLRNLRALMPNSAGKLIELRLGLDEEFSNNYRIWDYADSAAIILSFRKSADGIESAVVRSSEGGLTSWRPIRFFDFLGNKDSKRMVQLLSTFILWQSPEIKISHEAAIAEMTEIVGKIKDPVSRMKTFAKTLSYLMSESNIGGNCSNCADSIVAHRRVLAPFFDILNFESVDQYMDLLNLFNRVTHEMGAHEVGLIRRLFFSREVVSRIDFSPESKLKLVERVKRLGDLFENQVQDQWGYNYGDRGDETTLQRFLILAQAYLGQNSPNIPELAALARSMKRTVEIYQSGTASYGIADAKAFLEKMDEWSAQPATTMME